MAVAGDGRRCAVVVGGGIGGLTAAIALRLVGWDVTVLEQAERIEPAGAGISLFANAQSALGVLGVLEAARTAGNAQPMANVGLREPSGRWLTRLDQDAVPPLLVLHRADLHGVLLGALPEGSVRTGQRVMDVDDSHAGPNLSVSSAAGASILAADLVVGADGLHSVVRAGMFPDQPGPRYAGYSSWRGVTAEPVALPEGGGETWGRGQRFGLVPMAGDRVYWFATGNDPEGRTFPSEHAEVRRRFCRWHRPIADVIDATPAEAVLHHDICWLPGAAGFRARPGGSAGRCGPRDDTRPRAGRLPGHRGRRRARRFRGPGP